LVFEFLDLFLQESLPPGETPGIEKEDHPEGRESQQ
jgi:hypothetical protein